ncbi:MAG: YggS family pyridoxal phosphate-dependent enzyme [Peptococcaceae bacterium]|nr:MAG: YggS family pyridoxal phosphate-dependent enzyme [Peptococcaceae bacterium]
MSILENLRRVQEQIAEAACRSGRDPEEIKLVAVTKTVPVGKIQEVLAAGVYSLGESRVQELLRKCLHIPAEVEWHFIGHLQSNKVRNIIDQVKLIHSLDRWSLAVEIDRRAREKNLVMPVLVQVNVAKEAYKHGLPVNDVRPFLEKVARLPGLSVQGLMTMAPLVPHPEEARPVFRELRMLAKRLAASVPWVMMKYISMGMSNDFAVAVEEGANIIRVGSAIFNNRR